MTLTEYIKQARELCDKATKGPWEVQGRSLNEVGVYKLLDQDQSGSWPCKMICRFTFGRRFPEAQDGPNARFIAASRTLVPKLLQIIEMQNEALENLTGYDEVYVHPDYWSYRKDGEPTIDDYDVVDIGCIANNTIKQIEELMKEEG